ncbi:hypothetical protein [Streptomyces badius]|uniref:UL36 very large tegument protein n=1 Tax=Streptomyces badius TaxID=1941 RepID=A0ABQ2TD29_STRBA|nr:hypothetical protein [Streptomyces badius]GGS64250.1 hypothetical protein GCM10010253_44040 [Streptomyces badius]
MTVHQQAQEVGAFAQYLRDLVARLDPGRGWYGVFARRDPAGMRSCLDGVEIPPWDVVESLLADFAALHGARFAEQLSVRAATLYSASAAAYDRRPGGRQELARRLELMVREQHRAAERLRGAGPGGPAPAEPDALAWARDDHERATARCTELRNRLAAVAAPDDWFRAEDGERPRAGTGASSRGPRAPRDPRVPTAPGDPASTPAPRREKPRGARFAGLEADDEGAAEYAPSPPPGPAGPGHSGAPAPRGARFGGAAAEAKAHGGRGSREGHGGRGRGGRARDADGTTGPVVPDPASGQAVAGAVAQLVRLRAGGRSGEAHVVLCEVAAWPAPRLPLLALALHRAGLAADWTTLLWEVSSLPPAGFAAAAGALAAAGREADCGLLLRQGVARPAAEVADAALALDGAGRHDQARDLLGAFVRVHTPQEAAELARAAGARLLPLLLAAAREVSGEAEWDLVHALRVAGVPGV